jgi:hypothetical protein
VFIGGAFIGLAYNGATVFTVSFMIRSHGLTWPRPAACWV